MIKAPFLRKIMPLMGAVVALTPIMISCDDSNTVPPRFDSFFIKYFGDEGDQYGEDVIQTADGGYAIISTSDPDRSIAEGVEGGALNLSGDEYIYIHKTDSAGNLEGSFNLSIAGDPLLQTPFTAKSLTETPGGYLITGNVKYNFNSPSSNFDILFFEVDLSGNILFSDTVDLGGNEMANTITILSDGYIITGNTDNPTGEDKQFNDPQDFLTIKLFNDFTEDPNWDRNKVIGRVGRDFGIATYPDPNNPLRLAVFGYTDRPQADILLFDNNTFTSIEFSGTDLGEDRYYGTTGPEVCLSVAPYPGGFVMTGYTTNQGGLRNLYYVLMSGLGENNSKWDGSSIFTADNIEGRSVAASADNGILHTGRIFYPNGQTDVFLGKTTLSGQELWSKTFGDAGDDRGSKVIGRPDGTIVLTGTMNLSGQRKTFLIKTNGQGELNF